MAEQITFGLQASLAEHLQESLRNCALKIQKQGIPLRKQPQDPDQCAAKQIQ